ncbi:hypothetical protein KIW84_011355 [Lathyrus oleraceus]|uniref:Uncharacterized protein n=1 Tax=Pisum sativum TaxID=3888 RepID=A0A9D5BEQ2_PEA|nr:hypothetical protein KIW84_011355 [Pisum sativum]
MNGTDKKNNSLHEKENIPVLARWSMLGNANPSSSDGSSCDECPVNNVPDPHQQLLPQTIQNHVALHNVGYDLRSACNHGIGLQLPSKTFVLHDLPWASSITMTLYLSEPEFLSVSCIMSAPDNPPFYDTKGSDSRCSNHSML